MKTKKLGSQGLKATELGLGCMGMSDFYGAHNDAESLETLARAAELGIRFWDTADMYGPFLNEALVGKALKGRRDQITLATKFGIVRDPANAAMRGVNGKPEYVKQACEASLRRLGVETIDLYYLHRVDPETPIEDTVGAMAELVSEGKVRGIGLSEASVETIRKAHQTFPLSAVQSEYSLWTRDPEDGVLEVCEELGIGFVAYSPLSRGFLSGQIRRFEDLEADDYRRSSPRFQGENFEKNLQLVERIKQMALSKKCTPAQLALAWVMAQEDFIFPIPGTKRIKYLEENAGALKVQLSESDLLELEIIAPKGVAAGMRYTEGGMAAVNR